MNTHAIKKNIGLMLALMLTMGCTVGPDYQSPKLSIPMKWSSQATSGQISHEKPPALWWKQFNDPKLNSLVQRAVAANPDLKIAKARVREARAQYRMASANFWPSLDAGGAYSRQQQSKNQPIIGALPLPGGVPFSYDLYQSGFDASWEIDVFGGTRRAVEARNAEAEAAEYGQRDIYVTVVAEVVRNYVEMRANQNLLIIANRNIKAQEEALTIASDRFKNGLTSDLDVQQATVLLANTKSDVPTLQILIQVSIHRLGVLLGQSPGTLTSELIKPGDIPSPRSKVPAGLPSDLMLGRPDIQQAERHLAAATAGIGMATADLFPKFSLTGSVGNLSTSSNDWFAPASKFWTLGPTAQWRIFDAGKIRANIHAQGARQEQALAAYEKTALTAFEEVENALVSYAQQQVRHRSLETAEKSSEESLHIANQLYSNGLASFINVIDAERSLYLAESALSQSDKALAEAIIALNKALCGGWQTNGTDPKQKF